MTFFKFNPFTKEVYPNSKIYDKEYHISQLNNIKAGELIDYELTLPCFRVNRKLSYLPDLITNALSIPVSLLCSDQFVNELSLFKISQYNIFDQKVLFQYEYYNFNFLHFPYHSNEMIDFSQSDFSRTSMTSFYADPQKNTWEDISISSINDFYIQEGKYGIRCNQLVLKKDNELDFFRIQLRVEGSVSGFYISKKMANRLKNRGLTGFDLIDF